MNKSLWNVVDINKWKEKKIKREQVEDYKRFHENMLLSDWIIARTVMNVENCLNNDPFSNSSWKEISSIEDELIILFHNKIYKREYLDTLFAYKENRKNILRDKNYIIEK